MFFALNCNNYNCNYLYVDMYMYDEECVALSIFIYNCEGTISSVVPSWVYKNHFACFTTLVSESQYVPEGITNKSVLFQTCFIAMNSGYRSYHVHS